MKDLDKNQRKLTLVCHEKGQKEIKAKTLFKKREVIALRYQKELEV